MTGNRRSLTPRFLSVFLFGGLLGSLGCDSGVRQRGFELLRTLPHDPGAYTQGLLFHDGFLYESTGRYGTSSVRKVELETGKVLQIAELDEAQFGEGLALVGSELYQLTWQTGLAFVYGLDSLELKRTYEYEGEGWGLCYDGEVLFMSDGSDKLYMRDPASFEVVGVVNVTKGGFPVWRINELECVGEDIFANVFQTTDIIQIDKASGEVVSQLDGFQLSAAARRVTDPEALFNGIAHDPERNVFFLTGKLWQDLFEVRFSGE